MQRCFLRFDFLDELVDRLLRGNVGRYRDDLARDVLSVELSYPVELFDGSSGDVHFGTVDGQRLRGHQTDARTATGDQGHWTESVVFRTVRGLLHTSALDVEHVLKGESLVSLLSVHFVEQLLDIGYFGYL